MKKANRKGLRSILAGTWRGVGTARRFTMDVLFLVLVVAVLVVALRGKSAISVIRKMLGATFGSNAEPGTIRGDYGVSNSFNLIHGSDSAEAAEREMGLFFNNGEVQDLSRAIEGWVYDMSGDKPE